MKWFAQHILVACAALVLLLSSALPMAASDSLSDGQCDSLLVVLRSMPEDDTARIRVMADVAYYHSNVDTVYKYSQLMLRSAQRFARPKDVSVALSLLYWCEFHYGDIVKALDCASRALLVADSIGESRLVAKNYHNIGMAYSEMKNARRADENYHAAYRLYMEGGDTIEACDVLRCIAENHYKNGLFESANKCYRQSLHLDSLLRNRNAIAEDFMGLGATFLAKFESDASNPDLEALQLARCNYLMGYDIAYEDDYDYVTSICHVEIPYVFLAEVEKCKPSSARCKELLDSCAMFISRGYRLIEIQGADDMHAEQDFVNILYLVQDGKVGRAEALADSLSRSFEGSELMTPKIEAKILNAYVCIYVAKGDYKRAFEKLRRYQEVKRNADDQNFAVRATQSIAEANYDDQLRQQQRDAERRELALKSEKEKQNIVTVAVVVVLVLVLVLMVVVARNYNKSRAANAALDQKNGELESQKKQIERQKLDLESQNKTISLANKEMTDSLNYASLIQRAVMPSQETMDVIFPENMIIYKPLNIVSGDFFWASQVGQFKLLAVGDCTGHGVPGAFLSMLGMSALDYLVKSFDEEDVSAARMLDAMREIIKASLNQHEGGNAGHDGMDVALVVLDFKKLRIHYAGALRPMVLVQNGVVSKIPSDRMPIGAHYDEVPFSEQVLDMHLGDVIYLYSDGVTDQFGYDENQDVKKFTAKRFRAFLQGIHSQPMAVQKKRILSMMEMWRSPNGDGSFQYAQTDDAVVVGIRITPNI